MVATASIGVALRKAVADALTALFAGLDDFNGVTAPEREVAVSYGYDFSSTAARRVYTGRSRATTPPAGMRSGRNHRAEDGVFDLNILCRLPGASIEEADTEAFAIGAVIEDWFAARKNNELGVPGLQTLYLESWAAEYRDIDSGSASVLTYRVRWTARLT